MLFQGDIFHQSEYFRIDLDSLLKFHEIFNYVVSVENIFVRKHILVLHVSWKRERIFYNFQNIYKMNIIQFEMKE